MPTSPRSRAPRAAAEPAARTASTLRTSLYRLPGVHHTEAAHIGPGKAPEHEMAGRGRGRGRGGPILNYGRGAPVSAQACGRHAPSLCAGVCLGRALLCAGAQLSARSRVPSGALGHKGLMGKHGTRPRSVERLQVVSDLERIRGAGAGLAGTAGLVPPSASFPSSSLLSRFNGLAGRIGCTGRRRRARWQAGTHPSSLSHPNGSTGSIFQPVGTRSPAGSSRSPFPNSLLLAVPLISKMII